MDYIPKLTDKMPLVETPLKEFAFKQFEGRFDRDWGFERALKFHGGANDFLEFDAALPTVREVLDQPCDFCSGSGKNEWNDGPCHTCDGNGKEYKYDQSKLYPISASIAALAELLGSRFIITISRWPQLLEVMLCAQHCERWVFAIGGTFSSKLTAWMSSLGFPTQIPEMTLAMRQAFARMDGREADVNRFRASIDHAHGWLNVSCPGDACGLNPHYDGIFAGAGYRFSDHNVDSPMQQLTLLAGLAALHDRCRKGR